MTGTAAVLRAPPDGFTLLEPVRETIGEMEAFIAAEVERQVALLKSVNFQPE